MGNKNLKNLIIYIKKIITIAKNDVVKEFNKKLLQSLHKRSKVRWPYVHLGS